MSTGKRHYDNRARSQTARMRRRSIIDAAAALFLENGYGATTVQDIASRSGVSPQLVYASFGGKAGLLAAIVDTHTGGDDEPVMLRDRPEVTAVISITDAADGLRAAAHLARVLNERVGPILHLIDSVAGADDAVRALQSRLVAAQQEDNRLFVRRAGWPLRRGMTVQRAAEILRVTAGHRVWHTLVREGGWSGREYERWLADTFIRLLLQP